MAIYKTKTGYRIRYYDADGIERKKTIRGITRNEACTNWPTWARSATET